MIIAGSSAALRTRTETILLDGKGDLRIVGDDADADADALLEAARWGDSVGSETKGSRREVTEGRMEHRR